MPEKLPEDYAIAYRSHVAWRDGFRDFIYDACYSRDYGSSKHELAQEVGKRVAAQRASGGGRQLKDHNYKKLQQSLSRFFAKRGEVTELPLDVLSTLMEYLIEAKRIRLEDLPNRIRASPPFDIWRASWLRANGRGTAGPKPVRYIDENMRIELFRLQQSAATRTISAYLRRWPAAHGAAASAAACPPPLTSPSTGFFYVVSGRARAKFYDLDPIEVDERFGCLYFMKHPHAIAPVGETMLLDVASSLHEDVPGEIFMNGWPPESVRGRGGYEERGQRFWNEQAPSADAAGLTPLKNGAGERPLLDSVQRLLAFALSSSYMDLERLRRSSSISRERLRAIAAGIAIPKLSEILEIAYICRIPEEALYTPYARYLATGVVRGPIDVMACATPSEASWYETHKWYRTPLSAGAPAGESMWKLHNIGSPPRLAMGAQDDLIVGVFECRGPSNAQEAAPEAHDASHPSEEFLYVLDGKLGVRLQMIDEEDENRITVGTLSPGDAIWFSSKVKHCFYAPSGQSSKSLHFRQPLARGRR